MKKILEMLKRWFNREKWDYENKPVIHPDNYDKWTQKTIDDLNERLICPDCRASKFLGGPEGGCSMNILCSVCKSEFNFCPPFFPERIRKRGDTATKILYGI